MLYDHALPPTGPERQQKQLVLAMILSVTGFERSRHSTDERRFSPRLEAMLVPGDLGQDPEGPGYMPTCKLRITDPDDRLHQGQGSRAQGLNGSRLARHDEYGSIRWSPGFPGPSRN